MLRGLSTLLLTLSTLSWSQAAPTLTVRPQAGTYAKNFNNHGVLGLATAHGDRFYFVEASGLSVKDTKARYSKKDLEKLEARGIKILVKDPDTGVRVTLSQ